MKICPACKREYPDDAKRCRQDDTALIPSDALFAFQPRPALLRADPPPVADPIPDVSPELPEETAAPLETTPKTRRLDPRLAAACAVLLMLLAFSLDAWQRGHSAARPAAPVSLPASQKTPDVQAAPPVAAGLMDDAPTPTIDSATPLKQPAPTRAPESVSVTPAAPPIAAAAPPVSPMPTTTFTPLVENSAPRNNNAAPRVENSAPPVRRTTSTTKNFPPNVKISIPTPRVRTLPSLQTLVAAANSETPTASATSPSVTPEGAASAKTGTENVGSEKAAESAENGDAVPLLFGIGIGAYQGAPRHVVFLLDVSLSMPTRIVQAKAALTQALNGLGQKESFDIVTFDQAAHAFQPSLVPVTRSALASASDWLDAQPLGPGTNLQAALDFALAQPQVNTIVVITDGVPTVGETKWEKIAQSARRKNNDRARFYTIGLVGKNPDGSDDSFEASRLLQQLARDSGGECRIVPLGAAVP